MNIGELINDIDYVYSNTVSTAKKIEWINHELKRLYPSAPLQNIYTTTTTEDTYLYTLPDDIKIENIQPPILIENSSGNYDEYTYVTLETELESELGDNLVGHKYYDANFNGNNQIGIYPTPDDEYTIKICYDIYPDDLSASALTETPEIEETAHEVLKYFCLYRVAQVGTNPDVEMANNFYLSYIGLKKEMSKALMRKRIKTPRKSHCNKWW